MNEIMQALFNEFVKKLKGDLKEGRSEAAFLAVIRQFLKDNDIQAVPIEGTPLKELIDEFNEYEELEEEYEEEEFDYQEGYYVKED